MTRSLFLRGYLVAAGLLLVPFFVFAQEQESPLSIEIPPAPVVPVQNISVHGASVVGQENGMFSVSFSLTNQENREQSGVMYEVALVNAVGAGASFKGTEPVTLGANQVYEKVVSYPLKNVTPDEYMVLVSAHTADNVSLGQSVGGSIVVTESDNQAAVYNAAQSGELAAERTSGPAPYNAPHKNIHLIISVIALALALMVVVLAAARHKKQVAG